MTQNAKTPTEWIRRDDLQMTDRDAESASPVPGEPSDADLMAMCIRGTRDRREGLSEAREARERKRGERPENRYSLLGNEPAHRGWQSGFDEGAAWALSGDSDEIARLRAELRQAKARVAELQDALDAENHRDATRLSEAEVRIAELEADVVSMALQRESRSRELAEARAKCESFRGLYEVANRVGTDTARELAEARKELGRYRDFYESTVCGADCDAIMDNIRAHRAKVSAQPPGDQKTSGSVGSVGPAKGDSAGAAPSGSVVDSPTQPTEPVLRSPSGADSGAPGVRIVGPCPIIEPAPRLASYETAPTLEKGVRYRVVETTFCGMGEERFKVGHEFTADGSETRHARDGWYIVAVNTGLQRVQRVESAPTADDVKTDAARAGKP